MKLFFLFIGLMIMNTAPVLAEGVNQDDPCTDAGAFQRKNDSDGFYFMLCTGTVWQQVGEFTYGGNGIVAIGPAAQAGERAVAIGVNARAQGTVVAIGRNAVGINTTAGQGVVVGANSVINGIGSTGVGYDADANGAGATVLGANSDANGDGTTVLGANSGVGLSGVGNTVVGSGIGAASATGDSNILIGYNLEGPGAAYSNYLSIGNTIFGDMTGAATDGTGTARIGINEPSPGAALHVAGDIHFTGSITDVSDRRKKADIRVLTGALDKLSSIQGVSFIQRDNANGRRTLGLISQDVQTVYPEAVTELPDGTLALNYQGMIGPLVEAIKELDAKNAAQDAEIKTLRRMVHTLSARMDVIEGKMRPPLKPYNN